jgi:hypothetical protein
MVRHLLLDTGSHYIKLDRGVKGRDWILWGCAFSCIGTPSHRRLLKGRREGSYRLFMGETMGGQKKSERKKELDRQRRRRKKSLKRRAKESARQAETKKTK